jgi:hypothetical protein
MTPTEPPGGVRPDRALTWMGLHGDRLAALLREQAARDRPVGQPADDGSVRAHLLLVAEALRATSAPGVAAALGGFPEGLDAWFTQETEAFEAHLARAEGAIALEQHLQWGTAPGRDPSLDAGAERRMRLGAWIRLFAEGLEAHLGPAADGLAAATLGWMHEHHRELGRLIVAMDRHAKARLDRAAGPRDAHALDQLGQAAVVRAHLRHLVEALGAASAGPAA